MWAQMPIFWRWALRLKTLLAASAMRCLWCLYSRLCNQQFTATQYALLSALAALGRTVLASGTGFVQVAVGWEWFFVGCVLLALPSLVLLGWMQRRGWLAQFQR